jgi:uncharacterized cupin superfamily protein
MKRTVLILLVAAAGAMSVGSTAADELITYPDGSTAWRGGNGHVWGHSGGSSGHAPHDSTPECGQRI